MRIKQRRIMIFFSKAVETDSESWLEFLERESYFSLDFHPFGPSDRFGPRSKAILHGEGYVWTPIWWSSDKSKR